MRHVKSFARCRCWVNDNSVVRCGFVCGLFYFFILFYFFFSFHSTSNWFCDLTQEATAFCISVFWSAVWESKQILPACLTGFLWAFVDVTVIIELRSSNNIVIVIISVAAAPRPPPPPRHLQIQIPRSPLGFHSCLLRAARQRLRKEVPQSPILK